MAGSEFDELSRALAAAPSRRRVLGLLLGGAASGLAGLAGIRTAAADGDDDDDCQRAGRGCKKDNGCCSGKCCNGTCCANGQVCTTGQCVCPAGSTLCGGRCVATCPAGQTLNPSTCQCQGAGCAPPGVVCNGHCVACGAGQLVNPATCTCVSASPQCPPGSIECGGTCCGAGQTCGPNNVCVCPAGGCPSGTTPCGNTCCGAGQTCNAATSTCTCPAEGCTGQGETVCSGPGGSTICCGPNQVCLFGGGSGCCTPFTQGQLCTGQFQQCGMVTDGCGGQVDCGSCGFGEVCFQGQCIVGCSEDTDCASNFCNTFTNRCICTENGHCPAPQCTAFGSVLAYTCSPSGDCVATVTTCLNGCQNGQCVQSCPSGQALCAGTCRNLTNDVNNCGACGNACVNPNGTTACVSGVCTPVCNSGSSNCDGDAANGCEVNHMVPSNTAVTPQLLGSFPADTAGCSFGPHATGTSGRFLRGTALESNSGSAPLNVKIELLTPATANYDLYVIPRNGAVCVGSCVSTSTGPGEVVRLTKLGTALDDRFDFDIEVRYVSGASCQPWTLNVSGGTSC